MLAAERPSYLSLRAKGRPVGTANVVLRITPVDGGASVEISENPDGLTSPLKYNPVLQLTTKLRNAESLMRLEELALRRAEA